MSTSSVQQSDGFSFTYILYIHFHNLSPYGSSQDIQYSPLCYTVSFYCLSTLDTYFVSPNPKAAIHPSPDNVFESVSTSSISSFVSCFRFQIEVISYSIYLFLSDSLHLV